MPTWLACMYCMYCSSEASQPARASMAMWALCLQPRGRPLPSGLPALQAPPSCLQPKLPRPSG
jgi:hypothetical protein